MDINEPDIKRDEILVLEDENFNGDNVCIVNGAGRGIGRERGIRAAAHDRLGGGRDVLATRGSKR